jgi:two-component system LytT family response regulator
VKADGLDAVVAAGNYVELVEPQRRHLLRVTLAEMERQLDPARFARIHRSTIVNVDRIREIRLDPHGDCDVVLEGGVTYRLSRAYRDRLVPGPGGSTR